MALNSGDWTSGWGGGGGGWECVEVAAGVPKVVGPGSGSPPPRWHLYIVLGERQAAARWWTGQAGRQGAAHGGAAYQLTLLDGGTVRASEAAHADGGAALRRWLSTSLTTAPQPISVVLGCEALGAAGGAWLAGWLSENVAPVRLHSRWGGPPGTAQLPGAGGEVAGGGGGGDGGGEARRFHRNVYLGFAPDAAVPPEGPLAAALRKHAAGVLLMKEQRRTEAVYGWVATLTGSADMETAGWEMTADGTLVWRPRGRRR